MRVISLCSSSKANCTYIESNGTAILVDIGCSYKAMCDGLSLAGKDTSNIRAVVITHEHSDHISGLLTLTKKLNVPVFASNGTLSEIISKGKAAQGADLRPVSELSGFASDIEINAFRTPHDSAESVGYTFTAGNTKIAVCTDLGHVTEEVRANLIGSRFVLIEANYDIDMMAKNTKYPYVLKERIRSDYGHLSNGDSASFVRELVSEGTTSVLLGHLSQENNTPQTAYNAISSALLAAGAEAGKDYILNVAAVVGSGKGIAV